MVYEDESTNDRSSLDISSSSHGMMYRIPVSIDDEDYMGIENSALDVCLEHGLSPERRVAFEGFETGRRFLVCAQPDPEGNHLKENEKLNDEILVLNLHIDGLKKGIENLIKRRDELKIQIADQLKALEKNQEKFKMTRDILDG
ncbi:hypothetical protein D1007_58324 [Hordeum vulgare]|nr:hypothetical protein D1007_58324 [Hordeum vulgare]